MPSYHARDRGRVGGKARNASHGLAGKRTWLAEDGPGAVGRGAGQRVGSLARQESCTGKRARREGERPEACVAARRRMGEPLGL